MPGDLPHPDMEFVYRQRLDAAQLNEIVDNIEYLNENGGSVESVNAQTGIVVLDQDDIGDGTTYKQYSQTEKSKLDGIASGANVGVVPNGAITGATKTKITYDSKGLVTAGADATQDDIGDGTTYKQYSQTEKTKLSGIATGADVTSATTVGAAMTGASAKTTPVDADTMPLNDSAASNALKKVTWANIKATLKTYFDTLYQVAGTYLTPTSTNTVTNKRITPRVSTTTSTATPTINTDNVDIYGLTALATNITSFTTNLSGTPTNGQKLWISITGTAARTISWGSSFEASTIPLPTTTVSTDRLDVGFIWNATTSKWRCIGVA